MKNYYAILGVAWTEGSWGVRRAFLDQAKRYHPDHAGPDGTPRFQEIHDAYDVLVDPERRVR